MRATDVRTYLDVHGFTTSQGAHTVTGEPMTGFTPLTDTKSEGRRVGRHVGYIIMRDIG